MKFLIIADLDKKVARDYEVLVNEGVALRGLFIIYDNNVFQHSTINNLSVGRSVEETLRLVVAYQYTAKFAWETGRKVPIR